MAVLSRRTMLAGAAMAAAMPTLGHAKGPLVWMDMDQKELDDAYDQAVYAPNARHRTETLRPQQRACPRTARAAEALQLRPDQVRGARRVHGQDAECADHDLGAWRLVEGRHGVAVPLCRRGVHHGGRELCRGGLRPGRRCRRQSAADGRPDPPLGGLGLQERQAVRRRPGAHLCLRSVVRRALDRRADDHRLDAIRRADDGHQGRRVGQRHVRSHAGAAVEALRVRQVHRRDGGEAARRCSISTSWWRRLHWSTARWRRRSSSGRAATFMPQ